MYGNWVCSEATSVCGGDSSGVEVQLDVFTVAGVELRQMRQLREPEFSSCGENARPRKCDDDVCKYVKRGSDVPILLFIVPNFTNKIL